MTYQPSLDRTTRTDTPQRRPALRRSIRKRGILPSFGDIILPVVSVAAVGLLIVAGRQFFLNGLKSSPGISSTRAYAEAPALIAERENRTEPDLGIVNVQTVSPEIPASDSNLLTVAEVVEESTPTEEVKPVQTVATPTPTQPTRTTPPKSSTLPASKQWRVQIGAYGTRSGAQEAANKINKAGYKAVVYSNPASKYFKVWVMGGADRKSAEKVVAAMKNMGYKGSFSFPPAK